MAYIQEGIFIVSHLLKDCPNLYVIDDKPGVLRT